MPVLRAPTGMETKESAVAPIVTTRPSTPDYCRTEKSITRPAGRGQAVLCTQISGDEVSRLFPGLYQYVWRTGRPEAEIRGSLVGRGVVGLVIGTRPDCMPDSLLDYLEEMNRHTFLLVEYGIESTDDKTLCRINRGHTFHAAADAVERTASRGILTGGHVILGLPGETHESIVHKPAYCPVCRSLP
mgnify:CR=1 FL=1